MKELVGMGHRQAAIIPCFPFAKGITGAIAQVVEQIEVQFSSANLPLVYPIES